MADDKVKEALVCAVDFLNLIDSIIANKGFNFSELTEAVGVVSDFAGAIKDIGAIVPQFVSLSDADRADLLAYVQANVKFPANANVELYLQKAVDLLLLVSKIV